MNVNAVVLGISRSMGPRKKLGSTYILTMEPLKGGHHILLSFQEKIVFQRIQEAIF